PSPLAPPRCHSPGDFRMNLRRVPALTLPFASLLLLLAARGAPGAPLRTVWVDHDSRGGACSDGYSAADNAAAAGAKPWCTLAAAAKAVRAGDLVTVRAGTYKELMTCLNPGCTGICVLELIKKGTAQNPITYKAYPGETPIIDPVGQIPN